MKEPISFYGNYLILNLVNNTQLKEESAKSRNKELGSDLFIFLRVLCSGFDLENACNKGIKYFTHKINSQISLM